MSEYIKCDNCGEIFIDDFSFHCKKCGHLFNKQDRLMFCYGVDKDE